MKKIVTAVFVVACLLSPAGASESPAPIVIRVQSLTPEQPVQELRYFRKPGELVKGSYWRTFTTHTPTSTTYHLTPPNDWRRCETPDRLEITGVVGKEVVFIRAPGFETRAVQLSDSIDPTSGIDIKLAPVEPILGVVVDEDNKGIPDAPILIGDLPGVFQGLDVHGWDLRTLAITMTDKQGKFSVSSYPIRYPLLLTTSMDGFAPGYLVINSPEVVRNNTIMLRKPVTFAGEVRLSKGRIKQLTATAVLLTADGLPYAEIVSKAPFRKSNFSIEGMAPGRAKLYINGTIPYLFFMEDWFNHEQVIGDN